MGFEYILGPAGICLMAFLVGVFVVARAVLMASNAGSQLSKQIDELDRQLREARESLPEAAARIAELKVTVPPLRKRYAAMDKYLGELIKLESAQRAAENSERERRKALGTYKLDR